MYQRQCVQGAAFETFQQNQTSAEAFQQNQTSAEAFQHHQRHRGHHGQGAFQHQLLQSAAAAAHWETQLNIKNMEQNWIPCVAQSTHVAPVASHAFSGAPFTHYHGHFLVPVKLELSQLPSNQIKGQLMNFVHLGPVNFETLVFHTGSGELHKLGFYFNEHIMSVVVLNAMFNNSSGGDRAQLNQAPGLRVFNMQESPKVETSGPALNQALHMTADRMCKQQEMDHQHQTWRMEMAHAHLRTLDWVLQQEPYPGSDAQDSLDREEEMTKMRQIEVEQDVDMEVEEEQMACTPSTKDTRVPASSPKSRDAEVAVHRPLSPRRTRSGTVLNPKTTDQEVMIEGNYEEKPSFSPRRTRQGAFF